jgi:hypothetical protein
MLDTLGTVATSGNIPAALRTASERVRSVAGAAPVVVVLTDGQATTWRSVAAPVPDAIWTPAVAAPANRAVVGAEPRPARWSGGGIVRVTTRGGTIGDSLPVRIEVAGRTLGRGVSVPNASGSGEIDIAVADPPSGWAAGRAVITPDELTADDERWFATWNAPPPRVASHGGTFTDRAVQALASAGVVALGADVDIAPADAVASRPVLVAAPIDPSRIGAANRALDRAGIPWRLGAERRETARARGAGLTQADVRRRYALTATASGPADTLATVSGDPWIVAGDGYVLVASALDTAATTLPATAEFVPWLARMLTERLAGTGRPATNITPRGAAAVPPGVGGVELPNGEARAVTDSLTRPARAGVYFWTRGGARVGAVTVNGEVEESVLERLGDDELRRRLPATVVHDPQAAVQATYRGASRRPLGSVLLAGVLAVLLVETLVAAVPGAAGKRAAVLAGPRT